MGGQHVTGTTELRRTLIRSETRQFPWIAFGWLVGLAVVVASGSDDPGTFLLAVAAAIAIPVLTWLAVHRRRPRFERRSTPYSAIGAITSLLACTTFPAIARSLPVTEIRLFEVWIAMGLGGVLYVGFFTAVRWVTIGRPRRVGPLHPDAGGLAALVILVSTAVLAVHLASDLMAAATIIQPICEEMFGNDCLRFANRPIVVGPLILLPSLVVLLGGLVAWWAGSQAACFLTVGAVYVAHILWAEQAWRQHQWWEIQISDPGRFLALNVVAAGSLLLTIGLAGALRRDPAPPRPVPDDAEYVSV